MPKKTTDQILSQASKKKKLIAFDNDTDTIIGIGSLGDVREMIECYADDAGYDEDDIMNLIMVYELGPVRKIDAYPKGLEVFIEED